MVHPRDNPCTTPGHIQQVPHPGIYSRYHTRACTACSTPGHVPPVPHLGHIPPVLTWAYTTSSHLGVPTGVYLPGCTFRVLFLHSLGDVRHREASFSSQNREKVAQRGLLSSQNRRKGVKEAVRPLREAGGRERGLMLLMCSLVPRASLCWVYTLVYAQVMPVLTVLSIKQLLIPAQTLPLSAQNPVKSLWLRTLRPSPVSLLGVEGVSRA